MDVVSALRTLWRFRLLLTVLALASIVIGVAMAYRIQGPTTFVSRQYQVGIGSAQALVDTPSSQVADLGAADTVNVDIATLSTRAGLLANLMTSSPMKDEIAQRAGISPDELIAVPPLSMTAVAGSGTAPGVKVRAGDRKASLLKVTIPELQSGQIPIISVRTQAPDQSTAGRLANASIVVLEEHLTSVANLDKVPTPRRVIVRPLGRAQASVEAHGPGKKLAIVVAVVLFGFAAATVLGIVALASGWRTASELERSLELHALPGADAEDGADDQDDAGRLATYKGPALLDTRAWPGPGTAGEHEPSAAEHRV
jgi:hypothetical protein